MQSFAPSTAITLSFPLVNEALDALVPTGLRWRLVDEGEVQLQAWTVAELTTGLLDIVLAPTLTELPAGAARAVRTVYVEVTTATGTTLLSQSVLLRGVTVLMVPSNSFQTYSQALLLANDFSNLVAWPIAQRPAQEAALIEARNRIVRLPINTNAYYGQDRLTEVSYYPAARIEDLTGPQFLQLEPHLAHALRQAQLVEADEILQGDPAGRQRENGLSALTVGESSQFFRGQTSKPIDFGVCSRAYGYLARFVRTGVRIARR